MRALPSRHLILVAIAALACTIGQKKSAVLGAAAEPGRRHELFEATLRALDEKPEYVDEFFALALEHPRTFERFLDNQSARLDEPPVARMTARSLVRHPAGLRRILMETLDAATPRSEARGAILSAMAARQETTAGILTDDPQLALALAGAFVKASAAESPLGEKLRALFGGAGDGRARR